jgi:amino acid transporter
VPLAAIVFFNVSGGPYGVEDAVSSFGPGLALLLLVLTPFLWSLPVSLAMAELAAAMPDEGGYVTWVRRAFGPFWGFQVGWWSWLDSFVDVAVYPALFVEYLKFWYPAMAARERWLLAVLFIVVLTALNVVGVRPTGRAAVALSVLALLPIAVVVVVGLAAATQVPWRPFAAEGREVGASLGLGLAVVMWNYSGWDTPRPASARPGARHAFRRALPGAPRDRGGVRVTGRRPARHRRHRLVDVGHGRPRAGERGRRRLARTPWQWARS